MYKIEINYLENNAKDLTNNLSQLKPQKCH